MDQISQGEHSGISFSAENVAMSPKESMLPTQQKDLHRGKKCPFYRKDGTIFRYIASPIKSLKMLVVHVKFRRQVLQKCHDSKFARNMCRAKT